jgi:steroid 5-alpha reductase family enzyme
MILFGILFAVALVFSAIGFKQYIWFISIGYGFSIAAIGVALLVAAGLGGHMDVGIAVACLLFVAYGCRLGGYLAYRELKSGSYAEKMKGEIKSGDGMSIAAKCGIWVFAALLYAAETSPIAFRIANGVGDGVVLFVGMAISALGLVVETPADLQKNAAKKANPHRFVDTGLFRIVRCPNYFGEMLFWTGVFVGGIPAYAGAIEWIVALLGYLGIIYVMFSGARRLEIRQNKTYGEDPEYQSYVATTPIMIPLVPLYSVEKYKWLVA